MKPREDVEMQLSSTPPHRLPAHVHFYYEPHKKIRCPHQSRKWLMTWGLCMMIRRIMIRIQILQQTDCDPLRNPALLPFSGPDLLLWD